MYMPPVGEKGEILLFYYQDRFGFMGRFMHLLQWK